MNLNRIVKILCSMPVIIIVGFFIPFIGVCLIITRHFALNKNRYSTSLYLIAAGIIVSIPAIIVELLKLANTNTNILFLETLTNAEIYPRVLNYGKFLVCVGIIVLILLFAFRRLFDKLTDYIRAYKSRKEEIYEKAVEKNDMEIKIKQEKAKNTRVVYCRFCGADNVFTEIIGECEYCGRSLSAKEE